MALVDAGADPNLRCYNDNSDLASQLRPVLVEYIASNSDPDPKVVKLLLRRGARVIMKTQFRDPDGILNSLQHVATSTADPIFDMLLDSTEAFDLCMIKRNNVLLPRQKESLIERASKPMTLMMQTRLLLRRAFGNILPKVYTRLELPVSLHKYVLFDYS